MFCSAYAAKKMSQKKFGNLIFPGFLSQKKFVRKFHRFFRRKKLSLNTPIQEKARTSTAAARRHVLYCTVSLATDAFLSALAPAHKYSAPFGLLYGPALLAAAARQRRCGQGEPICKNVRIRLGPGKGFSCDVSPQQRALDTL